MPWRKNKPWSPVHAKKVRTALYELCRQFRKYELSPTAFNKWSLSYAHNEEAKKTVYDHELNIICSRIQSNSNSRPFWSYVKSKTKTATQPHRTNNRQPSLLLSFIPLKWIAAGCTLLYAIYTQIHVISCRLICRLLRSTKLSQTYSSRSFLLILEWDRLLHSIEATLCNIKNNIIYKIII